MAFGLTLRRFNHRATETPHLNHHIQLRYHCTADNVAGALIWRPWVRSPSVPTHFFLVWFSLPSECLRFSLSSFTLPRSISFLSSFLTVHGRPVELGPWTNSPPGRKSVRHVSDAGSHPELWITAAGESGNGDVVGSAMITKLNVVL